MPSYDNNLFAEGISVEDYKRLSLDPHHPLVNHAISGLYPPGSTFKIVPAAAALQEGVVTDYFTKTVLWMHSHDGKYLPIGKAIWPLKIEPAEIVDKMKMLRHLGVPYDDEQIARAEATALAQGQQIADDLGQQDRPLAANSDMAALIAYLQRLGRGPRPIDAGEE